MPYKRFPWTADIISGHSFSEETDFFNSYRPDHNRLPNGHLGVKFSSTRAVSKARVFFCWSIVIALLSSACAQTEPENWGTNTPGLTLVPHEGPREKSSQGTILVYNLIGKGFPPDVSYVLWGWPAGKKPKLLMEGVSFDHRGVLVCSGRPGFCKGKGPEDPVSIQTTAAPGEMKRFAVVSRDGRVRGFADAVPFPR